MTATGWWEKLNGTGTKVEVRVWPERLERLSMVSIHRCNQRMFISGKESTLTEEHIVTRDVYLQAQYSSLSEAVHP